MVKKTDVVTVAPECCYIDLVVPIGRHLHRRASTLIAIRPTAWLQPVIGAVPGVASHQTSVEWVEGN